ncbi:hypothetical protein [Anaerosacchariphilus polymeriproducens]|uniref:hypothetical protein n=1 Tax=Anaerosacchariphilus polymeriproducens TaxID=1812858 RepID=UPI0012D7EA07|nr:hypothetical protein [Anaerosacchariphilus polymeriproducens]
MKVILKKVICSLGNKIIENEEKMEGKSTSIFYYEKEIPKEVEILRYGKRNKRF